MDRFLFALVVGVIALVVGVVLVVTRVRASRAITKAQLQAFPLLRGALEKKKNANGVLAAGIFATAIGAIFLLIAIFTAARGGAGA